MRVHVNDKYNVFPCDTGAFYQCDGPGPDGAGCSALIPWGHLDEEKWQTYSYKPRDRARLKPGVMTVLFGADKNPDAHLCPWCVRAFENSLKLARGGEHA
jgi:hypothetical protein